MQNLSPRQSILALRDSGMSNYEIARKAAERGVSVTPQTISRIANGRIQNPSFAIGSVLACIASTSTY